MAYSFYLHIIRITFQLLKSARSAISSLSDMQLSSSSSIFNSLNNHKNKLIIMFQIAAEKLKIYPHVYFTHKLYKSNLERFSNPSKIKNAVTSISIKGMSMLHVWFRHST